MRLAWHVERMGRGGIHTEFQSEIQKATDQQEVGGRY